MSLFYTQMVSLTRNFPSEVTARQRTCPLWPLLPSLALWQPRILPSFRPVSIFPANKLTVSETSFNFHFHNHSRGNEQGKNRGWLILNYPVKSKKTFFLHLIIEQSFEAEKTNLSSGDTQRQVTDNWWPLRTLIAAGEGWVY